jgi:hypothetical protein
MVFPLLIGKVNFSLSNIGIDMWRNTIVFVDWRENSKIPLSEMKNLFSTQKKFIRLRISDITFKIINHG